MGATGVVTVSAQRRQQLARLTVLRGEPDDIDEWLCALDDMPIDVLTRAVSHALKTRAFFPVPAELRADADASHVASVPALDRDRERALPQPIDVTVPMPDGAPPVVLHFTREWRHDCTVCDDTGWASFYCLASGDETEPLQVKPWLPRRRCERPHQHGPHDFVVPCHCRETNPTLLRRRAQQQARYAQQPAPAGRTR